MTDHRMSLIQSIQFRVGPIWRSSVTAYKLFVVFALAATCISEQIAQMSSIAARLPARGGRQRAGKAGDAHAPPSLPALAEPRNATAEAIAQVASVNLADEDERLAQLVSDGQKRSTFCAVMTLNLLMFIGVVWTLAH